MIRTGDIALVVALLAVAGGCSKSRVPPCEGEPVALLHFSGTRVTGDTCPSLGRASLSFTATLSWDGDTGALLCPEQPEAEPLRGTRQGHHVVVAASAAAANTSPCACAAEVTETLEGDVLQANGDVSFTGELRDALVAAPGVDPATCEPPSTSTTATTTRACGLPCVVRWQVNGAP